MIKPRYKTLAQQIEQDIHDGRWTDKLPGVVAMGGHYGAAPDTVVKAVKVLAQRGLVTTQGTRGTFITASAPGRPTYRTLGVVGMLISRQSNNLSPQEAVLYEQTAARLGYGLFNIAMMSDRTPPPQLHRMPVDGLLFTNSSLRPDIALQLRQEGMPFVSLNRVSDIPGSHWIDYDNQQALSLCMEHLTSLGHRRIAWVTFRYHLDEHQDRMTQTWQALMAKHGLAADQAYLANQGSYLAYWEQYGESGERHYASDMLHRLLALPKPPTAIIAMNHRVASPLWEQAQSLGLKVPQDLSLMMSEDRPHLLADAPFLTHVQVDCRLRMTRAIELLAGLAIGKHDTPVQELIPYELCVRRSTGPYPAPAVDRN